MYFLLIFSVFLLSSVGLSADLRFGCSSLKFGAAPQCFMQDADILPSLHLTGTSKAEEYALPGIAGASACQSKCQEAEECAYFSYKSDSKTCVLKEAPSDNTTPQMVVAVGASGMISGPRECDQQCVEYGPIKSDCPASGPGSCAQLGATFDTTCSASKSAEDENGATCGAGGFSCCRDYTKATAMTPEVYLKGYQFDGETGVAASSNQFFGVQSTHHCRALCLRNSGCTHWNYVTSGASGFMGGACFLGKFTKDSLKLKKVEQAGISSYVGVAVIDRANQLEHPEEVEAAKKKGKAVDGTCFELMQGFGTPTELFYSWDAEKNKDAPSCQQNCAKYPSCKYFMFQKGGGGCFLYFGKYGIEETGNPDVAFGPASCDASTSVKADCAVGGLAIEDERSGVPGNAWLPSECRARCEDKPDCVAFTGGSKESYCQLFSRTPTFLVLDPARGSGLKKCDAYLNPDSQQEARRRLEETTRDAVAPHIDEVVRSQCGRENRLGGPMATIAFAGPASTVSECFVECAAFGAPCKRASFDSNAKSCYLFTSSETKLQKADGVVTVEVDCLVGLCSTAEEASEMPWCTVPAPPAPVETTSTGPETASERGPASERPGNVQTAELGFLSQWYYEGEPVDFSNPKSWEGIQISLLTNSSCIVSDLLNPSCWDQRNQLGWPARIQVQIFVSTNPAFSWNSHPQWQPMNGWSADLMEFLNVPSLEFDDASHGVVTLSPKDAGGAWPNDLTYPTPFSQKGFFHLRLRRLSGGPAELSDVPDFKLSLCILASDYPLSSVCADPVDVF